MYLERYYQIEYMQRITRPCNNFLHGFTNVIPHISVRERPFDFYGGGWGGGGGQEDVFGPGYFFANNTKRIVELFLSWIFLSGKLGPRFFFFSRKIFLPPPHKNQMVALLKTLL